MLFQVLDPVCCHLSLGAWNRLIRTCKSARAAVDTPLYWEGRYGQFRKDVMHEKGELFVFKSAECQCVTNVWSGRRTLSDINAISIPVIQRGPTRSFIQYLIEEIHFLNFDLLPHMGHRQRTAHVLFQLPMSQWNKEGYEMVGRTRLIPYVFHKEDGSLKAIDEQVGEFFETILNDAQDLTSIVLDEIVEELEPDDYFQGSTQLIDGYCPDCGREFEDDGFYGHYIQ